MTRWKPLMLPEHPVPPRANRYHHIAAYFESEGDDFVDALNTGREVAEDLTRHLLPGAREIVLSEGHVVR